MFVTELFRDSMNELWLDFLLKLLSSSGNSSSLASRSSSEHFPLPSIFLWRAGRVMLVLELDNEDEFEKVDDDEEEDRDVITVRELFARSVIFEEE